MAEPLVLVAGSLHHDLIVSAPHLPAPDETVTGTGLATAFGGKGGNQAVAAARMGAKTVFAGAVGTDAAAAVLGEGLTSAGVDARQVQTRPGPSGMSVAILLPDGTYGAVIVSAANLGFDAGAVEFPPGLTVLVLQNEVPETANLALAQRARAAGIRVILNAAPARATDPGLLRLTDLLIVNRGEAAGLLGMTFPPQEAARALCRLGPARTIVTLGADGIAGDDFTQAALPARVHSTHGAGDMFTGALAAEWSRGHALVEAARFAQAAASLHVAADPAARARLSAATVRARLQAV
jgi:ribokinase